MPLQPEQREIMLANTRGAAIALIEDLGHVRETLAKPEPSAGEVRRLSSILRRLLVEDDLRAVAAPRVGRVNILAQDNNPIYRSCRSAPYALHATAGASIFGLYLLHISIDRGNPVRDLSGFSEEPTRLSLDTFLTQKVICLDGAWASRRAAIKFVANVASGVHSNTPETDEERLLARVRQIAHVSILDGDPRIVFDQEAFENGTPKPFYDPKALDPLLIEMFASANFLTRSPEVQALESAIRSELA